MKKIFLFLGLAAAMCGQVLAQDTLLMDVPPSKYFYNFWPEEDSVIIHYLGFSVTASTETAAKFYTKDSLSVYGLAVLPKIAPELNTSQFTDTTLDNLFGHAKLYEAETDSLRTIGQLQVHMQHTPIAYYMAINKYDAMSTDTWPNLHLLKPLAVYEVYFDTPITVVDSFYVGFKYVQLGVPKYKLALYYMMPPHSHWTESIQHASYFNNTRRWRYYNSDMEFYYLMFPILTPDTVHGGDSLSVQVSLVDRLVAVQPNPATERVKVVASCGMERVTAYNAAGVMVHEQAATGLSTTLEVTGWPTGTYILHIQTPLGVSTKRLIVAR